MATSQCPLNYKMQELNIKVPNIGDFTDVEVIEVLVNEGQDILKNDPLITIESDKSSVEIPSNFEGKVKSLKLKDFNVTSFLNEQLSKVLPDLDIDF